MGFTAGEGTSVDEINVPHSERLEPYSHVLDYTSGFAATFDRVESYYIQDIQYKFGEGISLMNPTDFATAVSSIWN